MRLFAASVLIFAAPFALMAQTWTWQHPVPEGNDLNGVAFYNNTTGFAAGNAGVILKTTDAGATWAAQNSGTNANLLTICVSSQNALLAVAAGANDTFVWTTNGGATWNASSSPVVSSRVSWRGSTFYDNSKVYLCGDSGYIVESTDNGQTFNTVQRSGAPLYISNQRRTSDTLFGIAFYNSNKPGVDDGVAVGSNSLICYTNNAGASWFDTAKTPGAGVSLRGVRAAPGPGDVNAWAVGFGAAVWHTTDFGATWAAQNVPVTSLRFTGVAITPDGSLIIAISEDGQVITSNTGGVTWALENYFNTKTKPLASVAAETSGFDCIVGGAGAMFLKATWTGFNWIERDSGSTLPLYDVSFADTRTGYACGDSGAIVVTTDAGAHWRDTRINTPISLRSVSFSDQSNGYAAGDGGAIYRTVNGATTWAPQNSGETETITCIRAVNTADAWACSQAGDLLHTNNGGATWTDVPAPTEKPFAQVVFLSDKIGWALARYDSIFQTFDGGNSWLLRRVLPKPDTVQNALWFANLLDGWIAGNGFLARTTNGGATWAEVPDTNFSPRLTSAIQLDAVGFIDDLNGWTTGAGGVIYFTSNGGNTWSAQNSTTNSSLPGLAMVDIGNGWAAGAGGAILKFSNAGSSVHTPRLVDFGTVAYMIAKDTVIALRNSDGTAIPLLDTTFVEVDPSGITQFHTAQPFPMAVPANGEDSVAFQFQPQTSTQAASGFRAAVGYFPAAGGLRPTMSFVGVGAKSALTFAGGSRLDFHDIYVRHCDTLFFLIKNSGEIPVTISDIIDTSAIAGRGGVFKVLSAGVTIPVDSIDSIFVQYCPTRLTHDTATITIYGGQTPIVGKLTGHGVTITLVFTPPRMCFDTVCGEFKDTVAVKNTGNTAWTISEPAASNTDGFFSVNNLALAQPPCNDNSALAPKDSCYFVFQISPHGVVICDSTWLVFSNQYGDVLDSIYVCWCDFESNIDDYDISFDCIPVNTTESVTVILRNNSAALRLDSIVIEGENSAAYSFTIVSPAGTVLPAVIPEGDSVVLLFTFHPGPSDTGAQGNAYIVAYYSPCPGQPDQGDVITPQQNGACGLLYGFTVAPRCLDFGDQLQCGTQTPVTLDDQLTFTNTGTADLEITVSRKPGLPVFSFAPGDSFLLKAKSTVSLDTAVFDPVSPGCEADTLYFHSALTNQTIAVCMDGCCFTHGVAWRPDTISFGTILVDSTVCDSGVIVNTGSTPDTVTNYVPVGDSQQFSIALPSQMPIIIPPGDSLVIHFCFVPKIAGNFALAVTFTVSGGASPVFHLFGAGYSIGLTCVSLVAPAEIHVDQLGQPFTAFIAINPAVDASNARSFRTRILFDPSRLQFEGIAASSVDPGWTMDTSNSDVRNGRLMIEARADSTPALRGAGNIAAIDFTPYYGSAHSTAIVFDPAEGFTFNILPGEDSANPVANPACLLDSAVVTFDTLCGFTISSIEFHKGTYLYQNFPNPVTSSAGNIEFQTGVGGAVSLRIFNQFGVEIARPVDCQLGAGWHIARFDARVLPAGTYYYQLRAPDKTLLRRMIVIK